MVRKALLSAVSAVAVLVATAPVAVADDVADAYRAIFADPLNAELNLQYALLAEGRGEYRKALAAYERLLVNDAGNEAAVRGIQRVRRIIEPAVSQRTLDFGGRFDSNGVRAQTGGDSDLLGYASLRVRDERALDGTRWRTLFGAYGEAHARASGLNYANIDVESGPLLDMAGTMMSVRPAVGVGAAFFDGRFYHADANASATLEGYLQGAYQWIKLRAGYRVFDGAFLSDSGLYADLTGRFSKKDVLAENDALSIAPAFRWSNIDGPTGITYFTPGRFLEGGAVVEYTQAVTGALTAGVNVQLRSRFYADTGLGARNDTLLAPGASLIAKNLLSPQTDVRLDYRYEQNWSNQFGHNWQNHAVKLSLSVRR